MVSPGQADRRAVGRRPGRQLRHRPLPARCGASGTASTATRCATSGAARTGCSAEFATRFSGSTDLYGGSRRRPDRVGQPRHRARRLHARATWSPTTTSTTRPTARTTATAPTTTARGTAASRARRDDPDVARAAGPPVPGAADDAAAVVRRADAAAAATSSAAPSAATTTPTARTTRSPGSTGRTLDERPAGLHPPADRAAARPPGLPPTPLPGRRRRGRARAGSPPSGTPMTRRELGRPERPCISHLPRRRRRPRPRRRRHAAASTTTSWCWSTAGGRSSGSGYPTSARRGRGASRWTPTIPRGPRARRTCAPETTSRWVPSPSWCCRATTRGDGNGL